MKKIENGQILLIKNPNERTLVLLCIKMCYTTSHPLRWLWSKKKTSVGENVEELEPFALLVGMSNSRAAMVNSMAVSQKLSTELPFDSGILLLDIYTKEFKAGTWKGTCTPVFTAALFTIAKRWRQLKFPSTGEWINKMWCIHQM